MRPFFAEIRGNTGLAQGDVMPVKFRTSRFLTASAVLLMSLAGSQSLAQMKPTLNTYGATGLIEMPTAEHREDGEITTTFSHFRGAQRYAVTFQITPRLSGSFRYSILRGYNTTGNPDQFDRSFDLRYKLINEGRYVPAVTIGLQDFIGTGIYSGEYIVATKALLPTLKATIGVGWGRFSDQRRRVSFGRGGKPEVGDWFRGDRSLFGGLEWQTPIKGLNLKVEYSSDKYQRETQLRSLFVRKRQVNFGLDYALNDNANISAYYLYGSELGIQLSFAINPKHSASPSGLERAAQPVLVRPARGPGGYDTDWAAADPSTSLRPSVAQVLEASGLKLEALHVDATRATVYLRNSKFVSGAQAAGRAARGLTRALPPSVEIIEIIPMAEGQPLATIRFRRSDLEQLEFAPDGAERLLAATEITAAPRTARGAAVYADGVYPDFQWGLFPYARTSFFDPDNPLRAELGLRLKASYTLAPGLSLNGSIIKPLIGNLDNITRGSNSKLPRVRSDSRLYFRQGDPALERLTVDYIFKLSPEIYGRLSAGYLETMFGGVSAEVLWKPIGSRFALGAELNYVKQRDFDQRLSFRNYSVVTGHASAYYAFDNGFEAQIDAGRYLAGDWGATFSLKRTFQNGWKVGAFFTLTDVPFSVFGEGSFDKGITLSIPLKSLFGQPSRDATDMVVRPLTRDGGARLRIKNRLYDTVSGYDRPTISDSFGRVWR